MADPNIGVASGVSATGMGLTALITITLGQVLGEYIIILVTGLLGTLVALSESDTKTFWRSLVFVFRGLSFSFVFASILTSLVASIVPASLSIAPYAIMSAVSFSIGWTSNRWGNLKIFLVDELTKRVAAKIAGRDESKPEDK